MITCSPFNPSKLLQKLGKLSESPAAKLITWTSESKQNWFRPVPPFTIHWFWPNHIRVWLFPRWKSNSHFFNGGLIYKAHNTTYRLSPEYWLARLPIPHQQQLPLHPLHLQNLITLLKGIHSQNVNRGFLNHITSQSLCLCFKFRSEISFARIDPVDDSTTHSSLGRFQRGRGIMRDSLLDPCERNTLRVEIHRVFGVTQI